MAEERERRCAHIKAAKDWLGRAESSLERENDIKGGLSLMLAEAELQRARETQRMKRLVQVLAPTLALFFALGGVFLYRALDSPAPSVEQSYAESAPKKDHTPAVQEAQASPAASAADAPHGAASASSALSEQPVVTSAPAKEAKTSADVQPAHPIQDAPQVEPEQAKVAAADIVSPPAHDLQKLMLSAGRILRE